MTQSPEVGQNGTYSSPCVPECHERFVMAIFGGDSQTKAYQTFINPKVGNRTAANGACRLMRQPEIAGRLSYLRGQAGERTKGQPLSNAEIRGIIEVIALNGSNPEKLNAVKNLQDLNATASQQSQDAARLDPCVIARRLCNIDARPYDATELQTVLDELCAMLHVTPDMIRCYRMPKDAPVPLFSIPEQYPQTTNIAPPQEPTSIASP